jgi:hypothetical protein
MRTLSKLGLSFVAFALVMAMAPKSFAADEAKGSIKVTVKKDGVAVKDAAVRVMAAQAGGKKPAAKADLPGGIVLVADEKPAGEKPKPGAGGRGGPAIKEGKTDDKGEVTLSDIPAGMYRVAASAEGARGMSPVTVEATKTAEVTIEIKAGPAGGGKKPAAPAAK